jgi:hypothetical protein
MMEFEEQSLSDLELGTSTFFKFLQEAVKQNGLALKYVRDQTPEILYVMELTPEICSEEISLKSIVIDK